MIPVGVQDPNAPTEPVRERRRRFGLDAPLPSDPRVVERAVLRHLAECRPDVVVLRMVRSPELPLPMSRRVSLAAGVAELLLLWPEGRSAFLAIRTQAQMPTRAERAFAELCRASAVPLRVVRSLPEARQALDDLGVPSNPENDHAVRKAVSLGGARRETGRPGHDDATPERLTQARRVGTADLDRQGVRRIGDPFDTLQARGLLDRNAPEENARLWQAGDRLRRHWHMSRLDGLTAFDFTRDSVDTSAAAGGGASDAALRHRDAVRAALAAVGGRLWPYLSGVVIESRPLADLRPLVTDTCHARTADALVLERLREALHRLCDLWKMKGTSRTGRIESWRDPDVQPI